MKPKIIYISPGPVYRPRTHSYQYEYICLSAEFDGYLFTTSSNQEEFDIAGFTYKRKGVDILIESFKRLADRHPQWKLKIPGWFPEPKELMAEIGGHEQIFHANPVHHHEMPDQIKSCAIFVLPSRSEAMGRVLLEAMATGKPRIGSNVDGIPTVINNGIDGFLVQPGSVDDLTEKLDLLMSDSDLRKSQGDKARERAAREFSSEVYNNNVVAYYNEVINS